MRDISWRASGPAPLVPLADGAAAALEPLPARLEEGTSDPPPVVDGVPADAVEGEALEPEAPAEVVGLLEATPALAAGVPLEPLLADAAVDGVGVSVLLEVAAGDETGALAAPDVGGVLKALDADGTLGSAVVVEGCVVVDEAVLEVESAGAAETGGAGVSTFFSEHAASAAASVSAVTVNADRGVILYSGRGGRAPAIGRL